MSKQLFDARRQIAQVGSLLRQGSCVNAVQSLYNGLQAMISEPLLKSERKEFSSSIDNAVKAVAADKKIREQFALQISYTPGNELGLMDTLRILLDSLQALAMDEMEKLFREREERKQAKFAKGVAELSAGNVNGAKDTFDALATGFNTDVALLVDIAEAFEKAGLQEESALYLEKADKLDSDSAYIKNKLGIVYRKMQRYADSENAFKNAIILVPDDPYVYFNSGRLYLDWKKWAQAKQAADKAIECQPGFNEAKMLADYAAKRM